MAKKTSRVHKAIAKQRAEAKAAYANWRSFVVKQTVVLPPKQIVGRTRVVTVAVDDVSAVTKALLEWAVYLVELDTAIAERGLTSLKAAGGYRSQMEQVFNSLLVQAATVTA